MANSHKFSAANLLRQVAWLAGVFIIAAAGVIMLRPDTADSAASSAEWSVLAASGEAQWRGPEFSIGGWQDLELNGRVPDGAELRTGGNGSAVVAKGLDRIELRANTSLVVAAGRSTFGKMEIDQTSGRAIYTVEKRPSGTFSVRTPYVVAVVKGTKFDVDVAREETSVSVTEGRVGVSDSRSGDSADVTPGQTARSSRAASGVDVAPTPSGKTTGNAPNAQAAPGNPANTPGRGDGGSPGDNGKGNGGGNGGGSGGSGGNGGGSGGSGGSGGGSGGSGGGNGGGSGGNGGGNGKGRG